MRWCNSSVMTNEGKIRALDPKLLLARHNVWVRVEDVSHQDWSRHYLQAHHKAAWLLNNYFIFWGATPLGNDSILQYWKIRNIHCSICYTTTIVLYVGATGGTVSRIIHFRWWSLNISRPLAMSIPVLKSRLEQSVTQGILNCFIRNTQCVISTSQEYVMISAVESRHIARAASPVVKPENQSRSSSTASQPSVTILRQSYEEVLKVAENDHPIKTSIVNRLRDVIPSHLNTM